MRLTSLLWFVLTGEKHSSGSTAISVKLKSDPGQETGSETLRVLSRQRGLSQWVVCDGNHGNMNASPQSELSGVKE